MKKQKKLKRFSDFPHKFGKKKVKEFPLPMKFNAGLEKFEPELPIRKKGKRVKINWSWELIVIILGLILMFGILFLVLSLSS